MVVATCGATIARQRTPLGGLRRCRAVTMPTLTEVDEALRWATSRDIRVWEFIDQLLDARLAAVSVDA